MIAAFAVVLLVVSWGGLLWHRRRQRIIAGAWLHTATGGRFWLLDPSPDDVRPEDIARGLANECRYAGQLSVDLEETRSFYSVAEHCVLLSEHVPPRLARLALLHDAAEAYLGDVPRPMKSLWWFWSYRRAERRAERMIFARFGLRPTKADLAVVKSFDSRILSDEIPVLLREGTAETAEARWGRPLGARVRCLPPHMAERAWLARFYELFPEERRLGDARRRGNAEARSGVVSTEAP